MEKEIFKNKILSNYKTYAEFEGNFKGFTELPKKAKQAVKTVFETDS